MSEPLVVILENAVCGRITRLTTGRLRFDYDDEYAAQPDATPLSLSMPPIARTYPDSVISPWLWGLLPDNEAVLARWARQFHVSASSPFSLLATPIGHDCSGAVRFAPPDEAETLLQRRGQVTWLSEGDVEQRLRDLKEDSTAWLGRTFTGQFSLAGAQAKTALLYEEGRWGVPSGPLATTHILKPAVAGLDDHDLNEHLCLDAAGRAGLVVAHTRVARFGQESAIIVERYDRRRVGGRVVRLHQEDMCQAMGIPPSRKYQNEGGPGPVQIAGLLRSKMLARFAEEAVRRFIDALAWNWLIGGTDAHAKNYSLLLAADQLELAPLYDIASALPYRIHEKKLRLAMKIGGDYQIFPRRNPWRRAAKEMEVDPDATVARVRELAAHAPTAFAEAAREPEIVALGRRLPGRLLELVAERCARCLQLVD